VTIDEAYDRWSANYDADRNLTRDLDAAVARELLGGRRFSHVLEAGCGTGKNTALFAAVADAVLALDFSAGMLERARSKVAAPHVRFAVADLTKPWPATAAAHDLIAFHLVLEHVRELEPVFAQAARCLAKHGTVFVSELHPFRQYLGGKARFTAGDATHEIDAFVHHVTDFTGAAAANGLQLASLREWWHDEDAGKPPRLVTFEFRAS
jgi:malonyl-CoA O-methyltransferase